MSDNIDWDDYFSRGKAALKKQLEEGGEWADWTNPNHERYRLITFVDAVEGSVGEGKSGTVTGHASCCMSSDSIETLRVIWNSKFIQLSFSTPRTHFIADMETKTIVEFLSVCM